MECNPIKMNVFTPCMNSVIIMFGVSDTVFGKHSCQEFKVMRTHLNEKQSIL